ncbi:MAG TPA: tetratricopeptide repeat protein [Bacillota bacterium]|nr:tetratricopeptide repeat protein [Bacillota bacterium]
MDELLLINLEPGQAIKLNDYTLNWEIPLPMLSGDMNHTIKEKEIPWSFFIRGIVHVFANAPTFPYIDEYKKILYAFNPQIENLLLQEGAQLAGEGQLDTACMIFQGLTNLRPDMDEARFNLGLCYQELAGREEDQDKSVKLAKQSIEAYETIVGRGTAAPEVYYNLGFLYRKLGRLIETKEAWTKSVDLGIDASRKTELEGLLRELDRLEIVEAQFESGVNALQKGHTKEAIMLLKPMAQKYPHWWQVGYNLGLAYRNQGDFQQALEVFTGLAKSNPALADVHNQLGLCLFSMGRLEESEDALKQALSLQPDDEGMLCNLSLVYKEQKRFKEAAVLLYRARDRKPEDELIKHYIEQLPEEFRQ